MSAPLVADMLAVADRLAAVLGEESAALRALRLPQAFALTATKTALANALTTQIANLRKQPHAWRAVAPADRARVRQVLATLNSAAADNAIALAAARDAHQRLFAAVADAVEKRTAPPARYGRNARPARGAARAAGFMQDSRL
jgi:flagellar biosynthesis/type III secretory pathway chaperone